MIEKKKSEPLRVKAVIVAANIFDGAKRVVSAAVFVVLENGDVRRVWLNPFVQTKTIQEETFEKLAANGFEINDAVDFHRVVAFVERKRCLSKPLERSWDVEI